MLPNGHIHRQDKAALERHPFLSNFLHRPLRRFTVHDSDRQPLHNLRLHILCRTAQCAHPTQHLQFRYEAYGIDATSRS